MASELSRLERLPTEVLSSICTHFFAHDCPNCEAHGEMTTNCDQVVAHGPPRLADLSSLSQGSCRLASVAQPQLFTTVVVTPANLYALVTTFVRRPHLAATVRAVSIGPQIDVGMQWWIKEVAMGTDPTYNKAWWAIGADWSKPIDANEAEIRQQIDRKIEGLGVRELAGLPPRWWSQWNLNGNKISSDDWLLLNDVFVSMLLALTTKIRVLEIPVTGRGDWSILRGLGEKVEPRLAWPDLREVVFTAKNEYSTAIGEGFLGPVHLVSANPILWGAPNLRVLRLSHLNSIGTEIGKIPCLNTLEELHIIFSELKREDCELVLEACPNLKEFEYNTYWSREQESDGDSDDSDDSDDESEDAFDDESDEEDEESKHVTPREMAELLVKYTPNLLLLRLGFYGRWTDWSDNNDMSCLENLTRKKLKQMYLNRELAEPQPLVRKHAVKQRQFSHVLSTEKA